MSEEVLTYRQIANMIDISTVQAPDGASEIRELIAYANDYGFGAVHVLPAWVSFTRSLLESGAALLGAPVGFPSGGHHTRIKVEEARQLVSDGVDELDMMLNVGKLRSGEFDYVLEEIRAVVAAVDVPVKVILETHYLTPAEMQKGSQLCVDGGAAFVKTSTGWAETGATIENIQLIAAQTQGRIGVKAAGGIRDLDTLIAMYRLGARRFGVNLRAAVEIVEACKQRENGAVKVGR